jgi:hypothetical protein
MLTADSEQHSFRLCQAMAQILLQRLKDLIEKYLALGTCTDAVPAGV